MCVITYMLVQFLFGFKWICDVISLITLCLHWMSNHKDASLWGVFEINFFCEIFIKTSTKFLILFWIPNKGFCELWSSNFWHPYIMASCLILTVTPSAKCAKTSYSNNWETFCQLKLIVFLNRSPFLFNLERCFLSYIFLCESFWRNKSV